MSGDSDPDICTGNGNIQQTKGGSEFANRATLQTSKDKRNLAQCGVRKRDTQPYWVTHAAQKIEGILARGPLHTIDQRCPHQCMQKVIK